MVCLGVGWSPSGYASNAHSGNAHVVRRTDRPRFQRNEMLHLNRSRPRANRERGITLVELIVAIGALAVLLAVTVPGYRHHTARSRISAMLEELSHGKAGAEWLVNTGAQGDYVSNPGVVGLQGTSSLCTTIVVDIIVPARTAHLYCGGEFLDFVALDYSLDQGWQCTTSASRAAPHNEWAPAGCTAVLERLSP